MKVLVAGTTGFVGKALVMDLLSKAYEVKTLVCHSSALLPLGVNQVVSVD
tara:strand:- start:258 stop:407 length:150 start_codon:yes stop_codon:yes gene_type:complete